ncbi:MAG: ABC transporter permease [Janthinobacterium lividum]
MTVQPISFLQIAIATLLVVFCGLISFAFRLRLEKQLAIASARTIIQLLLVGYVLKYVFVLKSLPLIIGLALLMVGFASRAATGRSAYSYRGIFAHSFLSLAVSGLLTTYIVTAAIIEVHPWYRPQYLVPLLGMILGNCLTSISITMDQLLSDVVLRRPEIEMELSHGASAWEAAHGPLQSAVRRGMVPTINSMLVVGIVSLPGMMTGQILAGSDPLQAVKYQIVVMFMLAASTALGCMLIVLLAYRQLFNSRHQLEERRVLPNKKSAS